MEVVTRETNGLVLLRPTVHHDERGFFTETYSERTLARVGIDTRFVQDNHSRSVRRTLRGLHYQAGNGQPKLVRAVNGRILDVVVDLDPESPSFRRWYSFTLDDEQHLQLYIPENFAHGFYVLSEVADVAYKVGTYYDPALERGLLWNDPEVGIAWPTDSPLLSERDRANPPLSAILADRR